jgi:Raf kinase inhibitor-like YbhB/YbcL family protein
MRAVFALPLVFVACKASSSHATETTGTIKVTTNLTADNTCDGSDTIPQISYANLPPETKYVAFVVDDPDAPGGLFTHYIAWNTIPGGEKTGETGKNDFGNVRWNGPCPPSGTHHYHFRVYALDAPLTLKAGADRAAFEKEVKGHVLATGELVIPYSRRSR